MIQRCEVRESAIHNLGLFARTDISPGEPIIRVAGEWIDAEEADQREGANNDLGLTYIFVVDEVWSIDGAVGGNESRFANHSCDPNCDVDEIDGDLCLIANRPIGDGDELLIDYDYEWYGDSTPCTCGSAECRGTIEVVPVLG